MQYADLGYAETDGSLEWDNDYPNPITYTPPDQLTTDPGVVTVQFDNVLFAVRAGGSPSFQLHRQFWLSSARSGNYYHFVMCTCAMRCPDLAGAWSCTHCSAILQRVTMWSACSN